MSKRTWTAKEKKEFAERMKKARAAKTRGVKKTARKKNPSTAKKVVRKANPTKTRDVFRILIKGGNGQKGYWTGTSNSFDTTKAKGMKFATQSAATNQAQKIKGIPASYSVYVEKSREK